MTNVTKAAFKDMTPDQVLSLTDYRVMEEIFGKEVMREIRKLVRKRSRQRAKRKPSTTLRRP